MNKPVTKQPNLETIMPIDMYDGANPVAGYPESPIVPSYPVEFHTHVNEKEQYFCVWKERNNPGEWVGAYTPQSQGGGVQG